MASYFVNRNAQPNGDHEVHVSGCTWMPIESNRLYLGEFSNCFGAVIEARKCYTQSNGCAYCCSACNTG